MPYGTESTCYLTTTRAKIPAEHENTPSRTTRTSHPGQQGRVTRDNKIGFSGRTKVMSIKKSCPPLHKQEIRPPRLPSGNQRICLIGDAYTMLRPGKFHYDASTRRQLQCLSLIRSSYFHFIGHQYKVCRTLIVQHIGYHHHNDNSRLGLKRARDTTDNITLGMNQTVN